MGGHCIAVDPWFIVDRAPELARLIRTAREVNDHKPEWVLERIRQKAGKFKEPVIACLGLAFKADVDDLRESPACGIVSRLRQENIGRVLVCEPNIDQHPDFELSTLEAAVKAADIVVILVDHKQFRRRTATMLSEAVVIDTRGAIR